MSNLKQISIGMMQYTQDYDERYPANFSLLYGPLPQKRIYYFAAIDPYIKSRQIWVCPSESLRGGILDQAATGDFTVTDSIHYYYNYRFGGNDAPVGRLKVSAISEPSNVFMFWDMDARTAGSGASANADLYASNYNGTATAVTDRDAVRPGLRAGPGRHLEGDNYAYADGHVKWHKRSSEPFTVHTTSASPVAGTDYRFQCNRP